MASQSIWSRYLRGGCAVAVLAALSIAGPALAGSVAVTGGAATAEVGDGTLGPAATRAATIGPLPASDADVAAKAAANAAYALALPRLGASVPSAGENAAAGGGSSGLAPVVSLGFAGQFDAGVSPPDTTGAVGTTRIVQLVNRRFLITTRAGGALSSGTLDTLAGWGSSVNSFDPQIIWDSTTNRFYYAMDSVVSSSDNRLAFGFSKSASPNSSADWCKYQITNYGSLFPDYPKLGDAQYFILIGVDVYSGNPFLRADILALPKPIGTGTITTCPSFTALMNGRGLIFTDIRDTSNNKIFSPAPANQIDTFQFGYSVARNLSVPSTKLWIVPINGPSSGLPVRAATRVVNVPSYTIPSDASQPTFGQKLDTSDTRMQQAILSRNPARSNALSLFTAQAIPNTATGSQIRYYEIRPDVGAPILQRTGLITSTTTTFLYYPAISSDRRVTNAATGRNVVVAYNVVRRSPAINPRIVAGSSINGAAFQFVLVKDGAGPYRDFTCGVSGQTCRWGDYSGAAPDPAPQGGATSAVGIMLEYSPGGTMSTAISNWRTWVATIRP